MKEHIRDNKLSPLTFLYKVSIHNETRWLTSSAVPKDFHRLLACLKDKTNHDLRENYKNGSKIEAPMIRVDCR